MVSVISVLFLIFLLWFRMPKKGGQSSKYLKKLAERTARRKLEDILRSVERSSADKGAEENCYGGGDTLVRSVEGGCIDPQNDEAGVIVCGGSGGDIDAGCSAPYGQSLEAQVVSEAAAVLVQDFAYDSDSTNSERSVDEEVTGTKGGSRGEFSMTGSGDGGGGSSGADHECEELDIREFLQA